MFPNDDICNVDAAKEAAQRLFKKYKNLTDKQTPILGKQQVGKLMKDTYEAINMPYSPNQEDVFSFISVFDSNNDGKIQLKNFQEFAVKYLCGTETLLGTVRPQTKKEEIKNEKIQFLQKQKPKQSQIKHLSIKTQQIQKPQLRNIVLEKQRNKQTFRSPNKQTFQSPRMLNSQASKHNYFTSQLSPKSRLSQKESSVSTNLGSQMNSAHSSRINQFIVKGSQLFQKYSSSSKGVTESTAPKLITATYQLFNKKNFIPSEEDVKIWMKLCDRNKDGIVEWQDYKYFLHRTYERNQSESLQK